MTKEFKCDVCEYGSIRKGDVIVSCGFKNKFDVFEVNFNSKCNNYHIHSLYFYKIFIYNNSLKGRHTQSRIYPSPRTNCWLSWLCYN